MVITSKIVNLHVQSTITSLSIKGREIFIRIFIKKKKQNKKMVIENSSNILQTIYNENASSFTLSKSQEELVYNVIHDRHQNDFFQDEFITPEDTQELWNNKPVNDNVINTYFNRIVADNSKKTVKKVYAFNTQFITKLSKDGASSVKKWTKNVDLFAHELILMPVHSNDHWTLIV